MHDQRVYRQSKSYEQPSHPQSQTSSNRGKVSPATVVSRSLSVDTNVSKEAEVDALTDLLVQNMNVAGNPDFCGMHCGIVVLSTVYVDLFCCPIL